LALAGRLTHGYLYFTKPHYDTGLVASASFSNEASEYSSSWRVSCQRRNDL